MGTWLVRLAMSGAVLVSCTAPLPESGKPAPSAPATSADPSRMPTAEQDRQLRTALSRAGVGVTRVIPSKFDWLFASSSPRSATFEVVIAGRPSWIDAHFMVTPIEGITACSERSAGGETEFTVSIKGRPQTASSRVTGSLAGSSPMYFVSDGELFVMTPDAALRDILQSSLSLSIPDCRYREPANLPVLPWEHDVIVALEGAGIPVRLIGGSKSETLLGDHHDARVFTTGSTTTEPGSADVLRLNTPLHDLHMCSAPSSPGFTRWTIFVDGKALPAIEGSQTIYPLSGPSFFAIAFDSTTAQALANGLALSAPRC